MTQNTKLGCLYGIGVGPGDPDLITLKALKALQKAPVICVPQAANRRDSYALSIVKDYVTPEQEILRAPFPTDDAEGAARVWREAAKLVIERLEKGQDVAFLTEGDPMLFSTFSYVLAGVQEMCPQAPIEIIPGVSSVMAAAASSGAPLVTHGQRLAILPAAYGLEDLSQATDKFDTVVLMKVSPKIDETLADLKKLGLTGQSTYVRRVSTDREKVIKDVTKITPEDMDYFSLLIVKNDSAGNYAKEN
ncbi:MAG: precorrin-2 C(20)-methyltransferase [SAR202 cluster bacterium]|nr:precorrin-2 C(20)-methyltransferase [Chloroflexota bacterium]MQG34985.1 precorrin-2 C(20)-methyltransferase [SAR202 cluster bacterium]HAA95536.1 precorrin-2 C(20)-methyltransferase [Dehalococcoidia bacterium]HCP22528.1 precorrin-2 C(20)-methyltransferase [Dehalococcoidia bacterium]|tara:strand:+ start:332 stop:1075 length:744 start_codon:yes stop_codon:yes gene_type:complete